MGIDRLAGFSAEQGGDSEVNIPMDTPSAGVVVRDSQAEC